MNKPVIESFSGKGQMLPFRPLLKGRPSLLNIERKNRRQSFLTDRPGLKPYTLVFEDDELPPDTASVQAVRVSSLEEVAGYHFLLGRSCEMYLSGAYAGVHPDIAGKLQLMGTLNSRRHSSLPDMETAAALIRKLPMNLRGLLQSPLAVSDGDHLPGSLDIRCIHKKTEKNSLLSIPWEDGRFLYFNMFEGIDEFRFDHESDHVQGMLILEAMRQAAIATTHIAGKLPLDGGMTLLSYDTRFYNYIESTSPVILRAYSDFAWTGQSDEQSSYAICQIYQWGKLCAEASLKACVFMSKEGYATHRIRSGRIGTRIKRQFDAKVDLIQGVRQ
ncbi:MAG: hypothetical protein K9G39_04040 [Chlorobium sp.]|uniref:AfsA-related hotdog domain-containing protein n=1 Tax=Chlorobium sp. TaxID=1095 RepID=UPI0025B993CD|nr:AfsA-related hotdog domain-containing protein [Chlorobium sp.]MCF8382753.1 hypothetical protein [Chlorobium sp.]